MSTATLSHKGRGKKGRELMTSLPDIPLPSSIRSRYVENINGLRMHVLEAGRTGQACCCCCTAFRSWPIAGAR